MLNLSRLEIITAIYKKICVMFIKSGKILDDNIEIIFLREYIN